MSSPFYDIISFHASSGKGGIAKLAAYVLEHGEDAMFMTIGELAAAVGVSAGTISRSARNMGFASFADMQGQMRHMARRDLTPAAKLAEMHDNDPQSHVMLFSDIDDLHIVIQRNSEERFCAAATLLADTPAVHILGQRSSYAVAFALFLGLLQVRDNVFFMDMTASMLVDDIRRIKPGDCVVLIAFPRYTAVTVNMVDEVRRLGCPILGITDSPFSPLAAHAKVALFTPYESQSYFNSIVGASSITNVLLSKAGARLHSQGKRKLEEHNAILERWKVLIT